MPTPFFMPERNIVAPAARQKLLAVRSSVVELVLFFVPNAPRPNVSDVQEAWQVWSISGDQVTTEFEGKVPMTTFLERASVH